MARNARELVDDYSEQLAKAKQRKISYYMSEGRMPLDKAEAKFMQNDVARLEATLKTTLGLE